MADAGFREHFKYLLAGGIAGAVSRTVTAPLDRLKVLLQTSTQTHRSFSQFVSIKKGILKIYKDGGLLSFFRGNGLNIIKIIPESALKFYVFEQAKDTLSHQLNVSKNNLDLWSRLVAGGLAGLVSQFAIYPIETVKTRIMSQITNTLPPTSLGTSSPLQYSPRDSSIARAVGNLYKEGGFFAFYRGCGPALLGIVPYAGVDLAVFETLKSTWLAMYKNKGSSDRNEVHGRRMTEKAVSAASDNVIPIHVVLACGMFSGSCGAVLMYPLSLVRTRYILSLKKVQE
jgi:solute carrier family 25 phosphate transporter 23/24/25/41